MIKIGSIITACSIILTGCIGHKLTREGRAIRTLTPIVAQKCEHIGMAEAFVPELGGGLSGAVKMIRNKAASLGGNAIVVVSQQIDPPPYQHAEILAEVYKCDFNKFSQ